MGCFWISIFFIFILMLGWEVLALYGIAAILSYIYYLCRSKNVGKWEMTIVIIISIFVSTGCLIGFSDYKQYKERKTREEWMKSRTNDLYNVDSSSKTVESSEQKPSPSYETGNKSTPDISYDFDDEDYYEEEVLGFDEGYEDGYQDGRWRSPGFSKRSYDYDYEEGYAQGYYEAAHDEPDYKEGEEYDW